MPTITPEELLIYLNELTVRVNNLSNSLDATNQTVTANNNRTTASINSLNLSVNSLVAEDNDLHNEIHEVSQNLTTATNNLSNVSDNLSSLENSHEALSDTVIENRMDMDEEDWELHNEIHEVKQGLVSGISDNTSSINQINHYLEDVPQHMLLSQLEYEQIEEPNPAIYYFVYEEE